LISVKVQKICPLCAPVSDRRSLGLGDKLLGAAKPKTVAANASLLSDCPNTCATFRPYLKNGTADMTLTAKPRDFVLVHGAGHGGWLWTLVRAQLQAKGHRVFTPTLTGLADRSHLMSADITLQTHIDDVVNLFKWEDIDNAVLVGHSYAGWVVSGAIEALEDRVAAIVYLDAFLPDDGQRGVDFLNEQQSAAFAEAQARGEVSRPGPNAKALRIQSEADATWVDAKITPQPIGVSLQALALTGARERVGKKVYVRAPLFPQPRFDAAYERCKSDPSWQAVVMENSGHDPMIDEPEAVCALLEGLL
jgi:pimeloyl-ACP methyl ester carboxylesterase